MDQKNECEARTEHEIMVGAAVATGALALAIEVVVDGFGYEVVPKHDADDEQSMTDLDALFEQVKDVKTLRDACNEWIAFVEPALEKAKEQEGR